MRHIVLAVALVLLIGGTASPHHSAADAYDVTRRVSVSGTVAEVRLVNPHARLSVTVTADGVTQRWAVELPGHFTLVPYWTDTTLASGDGVTVAGWPARDGSHRMFGRSVLTTARTEIMPGVVNRDRYVDEYRRRRESGR